MSETVFVNENPFHLRLVLVCSSGHEIELNSGMVDPKNPRNTTLLESLPAMGVFGYPP